MAHEVSETRRRKGGGWENVHGKTGRVLKPESPFEKLWYKKRPDAEKAAYHRSREYGLRGKPSPRGGFARQKKRKRNPYSE